MRYRDFEYEFDLIECGEDLEVLCDYLNDRYKDTEFVGNLYAYLIDNGFDVESYKGDMFDKVFECCADHDYEPCWRYVFDSDKARTEFGNWLSDYIDYVCKQELEDDLYEDRVERRFH